MTETRRVKKTVNKMNPRQLEEAMRRTQTGETIAFGPVYDAYIERIFRYVHFRIGHRPTAEDLTADIFVRALTSVGTFDASKGSLTSWLYRIAHNVVVDHYRKKQPPTEDIEAVPNLIAKSDVAIETEDLLFDERLRLELNQLTPEQREILLLRIWEGLSYREIAELVGRTEAACKMSFSRGLRQLRQRLGPLTLLLLLVRSTINLWT